MFPLHCNKCFRRQKLEPSLEFHVSRCGHIVCASCLQETCPVCSKRFNGAIVSKQMPQGMADYFDDPLKIYRHFQKVIKFQYDQERRLAEHLNDFNGEAEQKLRHKIMDYKKTHQKIQTKLDEERRLIRKYREYIAQHEKDGDQTGKMGRQITAQPSARSSVRRAMSEPPAGMSLGKVSHYERPREQLSYMKPPIIGQTRPRYVAPKYNPNLATKYNATYMTPQITMEPRPRYPPRKSASDPINKPLFSSSTTNVMPQLIRTLGLVPTVEKQRNKLRTVSPIPSSVVRKRVKPNVAWDSIKSI